MYEKLKQDFLRTDFNDWMSLKGPNLMSSYDSNSTRLEYFNISDIEEFRKLHLKKFFTIRPERVRFTILSGKGILYPHKDHNTTVALNYYVSAGADATVFYKEKENAKSFAYEGKEQSNVFKLDDVIELDKFVAESGEAYLLDVSQIHSVEKISEEPRIFISYLWSTASYDDVLKDIRKTKDGII